MARSRHGQRQDAELAVACRQEIKVIAQWALRPNAELPGVPNALDLAKTEPSRLRCGSFWRGSTLGDRSSCRRGCRLSASLRCASVRRDREGPGLSRGGKKSASTSIRSPASSLAALSSRCQRLRPTPSPRCAARWRISSAARARSRVWRTGSRGACHRAALRADSLARRGHAAQHLTAR